MSFNKELFLENTRNIHLSVPDEIGTYDAIQDENVRERLETFIDYDGNSRLSTALGELCANVVGRTMFKILIAKKPPGMRVKIIDIGPGQTRSRNPLVEQKGSSYLDYEVRINLNLYDRYGIGIPSRQYYCLNEDDITIKRKSIAGSLFHEFTHCLHETEDAKRYNSYGAGSLLKGNPWYDKEELRTISGYIEADAYVSTDTYDPICNNCYCLHNVPNKARYYPRIGHSGFKKGKHEIPGKGLEDFCKNPTFNLAWPSRYMIA